MKIFLLSLLSRKFLLTVAGVCALLANHAYNEAVILLLGYIGVQGGADIVDKYKGGKLTALDIEKSMSQNDEAPELVSGTGRVASFDEEK